MREEFEGVIEEVYEYVAGVSVFVYEENKLRRMEEFMEGVGRPHEKVKVIHVSGTSGKTSTAYYAAGFLRTAGMRVGLTVSPHVVDVRERAMVDGEVLGYGEYVKLMREFLGVVKEAKVEGSHFEFFMGFFYWIGAKLELDYLVVEAGIGGTWDCTNVARVEGKVCLVADIGFDHMEILGETIEEITEQEAGTMCAGSEIFMHRQSDEVMGAVRRGAEKVGAKLSVAEDRRFVGLPGFQSRNASLALTGVEFILKRDGVGELSGERVAEVLEIQIPARVEEFEYKGKVVVLDGAHNPQKLGVLAEYMKEKFNGKRVGMVFALKNKKNLKENIEAARGICGGVILTSWRDKGVNGLVKESVEEMARRVGFEEVLVVKGAMKAVDLMVERTEVDIVVVTGSFYLVSEVRPVFLEIKKNQ